MLSLTALNALLVDSVKVAPGRRKLSNSALNKILNHYYQRLNGKTEGVTVHSIRNLSGFTVYKVTGDVLKAKEHLNHSNLNTTYRYLEKLQSKEIDYYDQLREALT